MTNALSKLVWMLQFWLRGNRAVGDELRRFQRLSSAGREAELELRLRETLLFFSRLPQAPTSWARVANEERERFWEAWRGIPITTKEDLAGRFSPRQLFDAGIKGGISTTGGSTGEPTPFVHDKRMKRIGNAILYESRIAMGWRPGTPLVCIWGSERDVGKNQGVVARIANRLRQIYIIDGYKLSSITTDRLIETIRRSSPVAIYGFSSMLEYVANDCIARGIEIKPGLVTTAWCGGEMLAPGQSELFESVFGVPILNFYGGRELGTLGYETQRGQPLILPHPYLMCEILDEGGYPCGEGVAGRLVWTSTMCRGTPFLRYDIGDRGQGKEVTHAGAKYLVALHGRSAGLIQLKNGTTISALYWNHLFKDYPEVRQFQVVVSSKGIRLNCVGVRFIPVRERQLLTTISHVIGNTPIEISWVEEIRRTRQGKLIQVLAIDD